MNQPFDIPVCESLDEFAFDTEEVRDLIRTAPLRFYEEQAAGYEEEQLFGLEAADFHAGSL
jgi:hypothetical protein